MDIGRIYGKNEIKSKKLNGTYTYFYDDFLHPYFSYFVTIYKRRSLNVQKNISNVYVRIDYMEEQTHTRDETTSYDYQNTQTFDNFKYKYTNITLKLNYNI